MRGMDTGDLAAAGRRGAAAEGMQAPLADSACSERDNKDAKTGRVYEPHSWAKRAAGQGAPGRVFCGAVEAVQTPRAHWPWLALRPGRP